MIVMKVNIISNKHPYPVGIRQGVPASAWETFHKNAMNRIIHASSFAYTGQIAVFN